MKFLKLAELPANVQAVYRGYERRFTFFVRLVKGDERYYAKDSNGTDVWAFRNGRWTCIKNA